MDTTAIIDTTGFVRDRIVGAHGDVDPQVLGYAEDWCAIDGEAGAIGDTWDGAHFVRPTATAPPSMVPEVVSMRQARLALLSAGLLAGVDAAINAMHDPQRSVARIEWDWASEVHRDSPLVQMLGEALRRDAAGLDALFIVAAGL